MRSVPGAPPTGTLRVSKSVPDGFVPPAGTCSLRPSLGATLRAAVAVQIVCPDNLSLNHTNLPGADLDVRRTPARCAPGKAHINYGYAFGPRIKYGAGSGTRWRHKSARSRFGHLQGARRVCAMEGAHLKSGAIIASTGEKYGLPEPEVEIA